MPGILSANCFLPSFLNIWLYNTEHFVDTELSIKLQMCNKLVVTAKKSVFFVIANGPRTDEALVCWQVRVANVKKRLRDHKSARELLQKEMYVRPTSLNGHSD